VSPPSNAEPQHLALWSRQWLRKPESQFSSFVSCETPITPKRRYWELSSYERSNLAKVLDPANYLGLPPQVVVQGMAHDRQTTSK
jgi:hypothetical protein